MIILISEELEEQNDFLLVLKCFGYFYFLEQELGGFMINLSGEKEFSIFHFLDDLSLDSILFHFLCLLLLLEQIV
jgi:hypothetical protein